MKNKKINSYLEEYENIFRAKKVWTDFERKQKLYSKSPIKYLNSTIKNYAYRSNTKYENVVGKWRTEVIKNYRKYTDYNSQVLIKITGADQDFSHLKKHIRYISRNGSLDTYIKDNFCYDNEGNNFSDEYLINGKDNLNQIVDTFQDDIFNIPSKSDVENGKVKARNETLHMVFSMKGNSNIPSEVIRQSAIKTIKKYFPHNHFIIAVHNDTANPHCHLVLKIADEFGNRARISPNDLNNLRDNFAGEIQNLGYHATNKKRDVKFKKEKNFSGTWDGHKAHHYEVVNFGRATYKFQDDENLEKSFFVQFKTPKDEYSYLWGKELETLIMDRQIQKGEFVRFAIIDQEAVQKKIFDKKTKSWAIKTTYKNIWDCSIENRDERELTPLSDEIKKKNRVKYSYENIKEPMDSNTKTKQQVNLNSRKETISKPNHTKKTIKNKEYKITQNPAPNKTPNKEQDKSSEMDYF